MRQSEINAEIEKATKYGSVLLAQFDKLQARLQVVLRAELPTEQKELGSVRTFNTSLGEQIHNIASSLDDACRRIDGILGRLEL